MNVRNTVIQTEPPNVTLEDKKCLITPLSLWLKDQTAGGERGRRYLRVRRSFSCRAEEEQGDLGELECVELLQPGVTEEKEEEEEEEMPKERTVSHLDQREDACVPTCGSDRLLVLLFVALVEVVQVADVSGFDAHQAGQTLHVFITEEEEEERSCYRFNKQQLCTQAEWDHYSRGFPFSNEDARQRQFERGLHHFDRQRLQLQRQVSLCRRRAGEPLQVDVRRRQHLTMPLALLHVTHRKEP